MCGICGFCNFKEPGLIGKMTNALLHRGPDDHGFYEDELVSLGHRRLSVIDLSERAREPLQNEDGSMQLVFNGEIYNFEEIRKFLETKGHRFSSNTDSEVVVHAYEEFGDAFVNRFNGMFAFALWDKKERKLILVRDRIGIKPLYYTQTKNRFLFASEIKAILKDSEVDRKINIDGFNLFMAFQCIPDNCTMFKGIEKIPPGHILIFKEGNIVLKKYWQLEKGGINLVKHTQQVKDLLIDSVRLRLKSDVPVGVLLSGGIDSSILVSIASKFSSKQLKTFTVGFGKHDDEFGYANIVAKKFDTQHYEFMVRPMDLKNLLNKIVYHMDEPLADGGAIANYLVSETVRSEVKVILVGEGSDEIFGGYKWHKLSCLPFNFLPEIAKRKLYFYLTTFCTNNKEIPFNFLVQRFNDLLEKNRKHNFFNKMSQFELKHILPNSLLMKVDKMTMAHSIEARVPFLDHRVIEYLYNLSLTLRPEKIVGKRIIKEAFKDNLPKIIIKRRKHGFIVPIGEWLRNDLKDFAEDILLYSKTFYPQDIPKKEIEKLFLPQRHPLKSIEQESRLWRLLIFQLWAINLFNP